jgi:hypothetical protein
MVFDLFGHFHMTNQARPTRNLPAFAAALRERLRQSPEAAQVPTRDHQYPAMSPRAAELAALAADLQSRLSASREAALRLTA